MQIREAVEDRQGERITKLQNGTYVQGERIYADDLYLLHVQSSN